MLNLEEKNGVRPKKGSNRKTVKSCMRGREAWGERKGTEGGLLDGE